MQEDVFLRLGKGSLPKMVRINEIVRFPPYDARQSCRSFASRGRKVLPMQDLRRIVFSNEELQCAFEAYARRMPEFLPAGKLLSCTPIGQAGTESAVKIKMQTDDTDEKKGVELLYRGTDVLQPLILFCLENNVMLPRDGRKAFLVVDASANLIIELNLEFDLAFEEAPLRSEDIEKLKNDPSR